MRTAHSSVQEGGFFRIPLLIHAVIALALFSGWGWGAGSTSTLEVRDFDGGQHVLTIELDASQAWILEWRHSVTGILVQDYFRIREGRIVLEQSHMPSFDAGLGHIPGRGRLESDGNQGYWVRDINEPVPGNRFVLRVGDVGVNDHTLIIGDRRINLSLLVPRQRVVMTIGAP